MGMVERSLAMMTPAPPEQPEPRLRSGRHLPDPGLYGIKSRRLWFFLRPLLLLVALTILIYAWQITR